MSDSAADPTVLPQPPKNPLGQELDPKEVFDLIRGIHDPEYPNTLEELNIVKPEFIKVNNQRRCITIQFTPTIPHCTMCMLIGLCIKTRLDRSLPMKYKSHIFITPGTHEDADAVNKQLDDKERVAAALENPRLRQVVDKSLIYCDAPEGAPAKPAAEAEPKSEAPAS
ncbi:putative mitotic spindle-associated MMXD complex subunit MIP18 [Paratrimastix pyriformis]|uniref:Mitotic spindle-associated MMXD complex subunit MIP18 n=1 Tax=Paratrimastix pyriformis TaxID=342808 RepID=A0ABQ8UKP4_9EUKA|nr:putative mitotic spindle-associated MMXD complex subunit MIP18 [Paratrimastix pyriformis]|eukprot:GAFH01005427.1.p2 GENE.GAFH01005427.1~~GAFH01005427.1.p2  ORF type:complete len:168 (-),score=25.99 GAFH01005427.1:125-628(-)